MTEDALRQQRQAWQENVLEPLLKKAPERKEVFQTASGIPEPRLLTPTDVPVDYLHDLGFPGQYPFTRGVQPTMYRGRFWTMRQYAGYATAEESNARYRYLLSQGQTGLSVAFDLPTQLGYDSDHPLAAGEVGKVGVAISSLADMERLLEGIPLDKVSISMTINAPAAVLLAMVVVVGEKQGVPQAKLRGTVQNDVLKEYIARGTYIFPPRPSLRLTVDIFRYTTEHIPHWNSISVSGYHIREAGSNAVQELAFTLSNGIAYVQAAIDAGLDVNRFARQISFFFNAHNNLFEEIAKFRAARRIWARIMKERFGVTDAKAMKLRFHTQTAGSTLTAQQPQNNVVRVTLQALAAVLGGTQSLHTNSMDEALALPSEASVEVALRTQQIIAYESGVTESVDPLAGSYYVEHLTNEVERRAMAYIQRIDDMGGALRAIETGFMQREIQESAYRAQQAVERAEQIVVGVNRFQDDREHPPESLLRIDPTAQQRQVERLQAFKARRDQQAVRRALAVVEAAARDQKAPLMPVLLEAVRAYATLGEIHAVLRQVFGEYSAPTGL